MLVLLQQGGVAVKVRGVVSDSPPVYSTTIVRSSQVVLHQQRDPLPRKQFRKGGYRKKEAGVVMKPGGRRHIQEEGGRSSDEAWREKVHTGRRRQE
jgi:hypothetical protein